MASASIVVSHIAQGFSFRSGDAIGVSSMAVPHGRPAGRPKVLRVTCAAKSQPDPTNDSNSEGLERTPLNTATESPRPAAAPKRGTSSSSFGEIFGFSGAAPETVNGRLAMVGFVSALGVEAWTGHDLLWQLSNGGVTWFAATATLFTAASLIPLVKGVSRESISRSQRFMSSNAETWNGRFAMLGLVALACTEYLKGGPLV